MVDLLALQGREALHLLHWQEGEQAETVSHIRIGNIAPVLVEFIGRCFLGIQPKRAALGFPHLFAIAF